MSYHVCPSVTSYIHGKGYNFDVHVNVFFVENGYLIALYYPTLPSSITAQRYITSFTWKAVMHTQRVGVILHTVHLGQFSENDTEYYHY